MLKCLPLIIWQSMDDLKHKLFYTNRELQKMKMKADVTLRKHKDTVQHLLNLLANAYKERDGARDQLHKLIYKSMSSRSPDQILAQVQPESPILNMYPKANLSKSKSNSEAYSHLLHCSSSVDSFDAAATPDFPNKNMGEYFMVTGNGRTNMYTEEERASEETLKEEMKLHACSLPFCTKKFKEKLGLPIVLIRKVRAYVNLSISN
ncbi:hypothetical protein POTOM_039062 [Populus tomentosa]|uniref:Uncharacterized protein n=1 Tax=Populus tomentosa TaxID=118781 RepID=A0A8X7Z255_POPTO|nr:hypothetical protein POTOM_039062 [Populus tomentosa]